MTIELSAAAHAARQTAEWNRRYPVGTAIEDPDDPTSVCATRAPALVLFGRKPAVYLDGRSGYYPIAALAPTAAARAAADRHDAELAAQAPLPRAVMFPGQGAQRIGMGAALFDAYPQLVARADAVLGYSIADLCLVDADGRLDNTRYTQPALYVVNALEWQRRVDSGDPSRDADCFLGHSLGEYNALYAAGAFDFETGLRLVVRRGELMSAASGGAMAAVLHLEAGAIRRCLDHAGLDAVDLANYNTPSQTVVSGPADAVASASLVLQTHGATVVPLKVSGAFHSRQMRAARESYAGYLAQFRFVPPGRPVIANATALPYDADGIARVLAEQVASPVRWADSVRYLLDRGTRDFIEIGGAVLGKMVAEVRRAAGI